MSTIIGPGSRSNEEVAWAAYEEGSWELSTGERWSAGHVSSVD